ncbi:hypothetical protein CLOM_g24217 [Closterium sp. NIES-68]|nr:hypothetical protein CLOM_g24217 [Closterium sp. NIES-68]
MFEHIKDLVEADDSGPRAWKLLCDVIQPNTLPMVIVLEKELAAISMRPRDDVKPALDKIKDTYARMAAAGSSVSQLQQCTKIISVLDNSWDNLIPTLNSQQDQLTPEWLRQQILQEDLQTPCLSANLLSVRRLQKSKAEVTFGPTSCRAKLGKKPNTLPMVIVLEKELAAISMRPRDDVKPALDKIKDTYARMAAAGSSVSQLQQCTKIISVLDNSWDNLIPTLNSQQDQLTPESVC